MKKTITIGITGSIAAYKAADLTSQLIKKGYDIKVIMTASAMQLITPMTFFTLSRNPVVTSLWDVPDWKPGHISLADETNLFIVAPATANFIGKYANGIADDALTTFALSFDGKVIVAPAMNPRMWQNVVVQENVEKLQNRGVKIIIPIDGVVACGDKGVGKLAPIEEIIKIIEENI